jgi:hypothetical protein
MRKYILLGILALLTPNYVWATGAFEVENPAVAFGVDDPDDMFGVSGLAVPPSCCNTLTFASGDQESFECPDADDCCTDATVTDNDGIIDTYSTTYGAAPGLGTHAAVISISGANQEDNIIQFPLPSGDSDCTEGFWYYVVDVDDYQEVYIAAVSSTTNPTASYQALISHRHVGTGNASIRLRDSDEDEGTTVTTAAWYFIELDLDQAGSTVMKVYNAAMSLQGTDTITGENNAAQYLTFGCLYSTSAISHDLVYDGAKYQDAGGGF